MPGVSTGQPSTSRQWCQSALSEGTVARNFCRVAVALIWVGCTAAFVVMCWLVAPYAMPSVMVKTIVTPF